MKRLFFNPAVLPAVLLFFLVPVKDSFVQVFFPDGAVITAELAVTEEEKQIGLMFREKIYPDQGMLFIFKQPEIQSFWMKNMKFSIDILWLDEDKRIIHIEQNVPPCESEDCPSYTGLIPAKYVLELKEGCVKEHRLELSDRIDFILDSDLT